MDYEYILIQKKGIKVYNIPPMSSNKGHFLDSWKNKITEVNLKISAKGHKASITLTNYDGTLFAVAHLPENYEQAVVKCADSSRGFALKLVDPTGKAAWIGMVFPERNDSFDFTACLQDFEKNRDMELNPQKYAAENKPTQNFALKQGEKISFNIGGGTSDKPKPTSGKSDFKLLPPPGSGTGFKLPPPGTTSKPVQMTQPQTNTNSGFGDFGNFGQSSFSNQNQGGGFGGFGQNTQQQSSNSNDFDLLGGFSNQSKPSTNNTSQQKQNNEFFDLI